MEPTNSKFKKNMMSKKKEKNGSYLPFSCGNHANASYLCFFCAMEEADPSTRRAQLAKCFHEMPYMEEQGLVLVMSGLWHIAMAQPNDPEFPALGIFSSMANLINRGVEDKAWLQKHHNIFIPYYAAHIIVLHHQRPGVCREGRELRRGRALDEASKGKDELG